MSQSQWTTDDIRHKVRETLVVELGEEIISLPDDTSLADAFGDRYDSLAALECIILVEKAFGIEVDFVANDIRYWFSTPGRIEQFVAEQIEDRQTMGGATWRPAT